MDRPCHHPQSHRQRYQRRDPRTEPWSPQLRGEPSCDQSRDEACPHQFQRSCHCLVYVIPFFPLLHLRQSLRRRPLLHHRDQGRRRRRPLLHHRDQGRRCPLHRRPHRLQGLRCQCLESQGRHHPCQEVLKW